MKMLGDLSRGRDNNLNLIRLIAALAVLVSHAWPITGGPGTSEPIQDLTGVTLGTYAVMVFFGLSGFLITGSYLRDTNPRRFCERRARRILPALLACLALTVFFLGPAVSDYAVEAYFQDLQTWTFLVVNGLMIGFQGDLPGVFQANPYPAVAGSIWTLHYEVLCYGVVLFIGMTGLLASQRLALLALGVAAMAAVFVIAFNDLMPTRLWRLAQLFLPFACGCAAWVLRGRIPLSPIILIALISCSYWAFDSVLQPVTDALTITYGTLLVGYRRSLQIWLPGDYSYGVYIYAFPVQGFAVMLGGPMDPWTNIAVSTPLTLVFAVVSWHLVERPWLRRRAMSGRASALPMIEGKT